MRKAGVLTFTYIFLLQSVAFAAAPVIQTTTGVRGGDDTLEGMIDFIAPLYGTEDSLLFLNPRVSLRDGGENEVNIGLGLRGVVPSLKAVLGGNVYFDSRESEYGNRFNQLGLGVEFLSKWMDARANYYLPEDKEEMIHEVPTQEEKIEVDQAVSSSARSSATSASRLAVDGPEARTNSIVQDATTTTVTTTRTTTTTTTTTTTRRTVTDRLFEQFERGLKGFDAEIGVLLPLPASVPQTRLFGGYYDFDGRFGGNIAGFKGRLEIRAFPFLTVDAEVFEDKELNGTDYFVGCRMQVPFDTGAAFSGKNPFRGAFSGKPDASLKGRMEREMVMRDVRVQMEESDFMENVASRKKAVNVDVDVTKKTSTSTSTKTTSEVATTDLATNITYVDGENTTGTEDGTAENPFVTPNGGTTNAAANNTIFVDDTQAGGGTYGGTVTMQDGQTLTSAIDVTLADGTPYTFTDADFGADATGPPVITSGGDAVVVADNTVVRRVVLNAGDGASGIRANNRSGTVQVFDTDISNGVGIDIAGGDAAFTFGNVNIADTGGADRTFNLNGGSSTVMFDGMITQPGNAAMVFAGAGHSGAVTFSPTSTLSATNGDGLQFDNADGTYTFNGTTTLNGGDAGIDILGNSNGTFTFASATSIANPSGHAFNVLGDDTNSPAVTYTGTIGNNANAAIRLWDTAAGNTITFNSTAGDAIVDNGSGLGIDIIDIDQNVDILADAERSGANGIDIGQGTGIFTFADTDVSGMPDEPLEIVSGLGTINFQANSSITQSQNAAAVLAFNDSSALNFDGALGATNGNGLQFTNADGTYDFNGPLTLNGGDAGIDIIGGSDGAFTFGGTASISNSTGMAVNIDGGGGGQNAQVTFDGLDVNQSVGNGVRANNSGTLTINSGEIDNTTGDGINSTNTNLNIDLSSIGVNAGIGGDGIEITNSDATGRTVTITNSNIFPLTGTGIADRGIFVNSSGTGTLTASIEGNMIDSANQAVLTSSGVTAGSLVLDLQNSTLARGTAGFTEEHTGGGLNSTIVRSWNGPNQVVGVPSGTGGILFDRITFDASGTALSGTQVVLGGTATLQIGSAVGRVQGDGLSLLNPTGDLNIGTLSIFNNAGTGLEVDTKGLGTTFNLATGGGMINTIGGAALFLDPLSGTMAFSSVSSSNSSTDGLILTGNPATLNANFGNVTISDPGGNGITIGPSDSGNYTFGNVDITGLGANGTGVDLAGAQGTVSFGTLDISGAGGSPPAGSTGIDLSGSTSSSNMTTIGSGTIQNVVTGVGLTNAAIGGTFQYGDGSNTDANGAASTISATTPIVITGLDGTSGTYDFEDVNLTGDTSGLEVGDVFWVDATTNGAGTRSDPGSVAAAENSSADTIILVHDGSAGTITAAASNADDTFQLDSGQDLLSFLKSDTLNLSGGAPANVLLFGITSGAVTNPNAGMTPELTTTSGDLVTLGDNNTLDGISIAGGSGAGNAISGSSITGAAVRNSDISWGGSGGLDFTGTGGAVTLEGSTVETTGVGNSVTLSGNSGTVTMTDVSLTTANGSGVVASDQAGTLTVNGTSSISATGGAALDISQTGAGTTPLSMSFGSLTSSGSSTEGIFLDGVSGSLTAATSTTVTNANGGIVVEDAGGASLNFGATTIDDTSIGAGASGDGIDIATGNAGASFTFASLDVTTDGGTGLLANSSGTVNLTGTTASIDATGGAALDITSTTGLTNGVNGWTFDGVVSVNSSGDGVRFSNVGQSISLAGVDISNAAGDGIELINVTGATNSIGGTGIDGAATDGHGISLTGVTGTTTVEGASAGSKFQITNIGTGAGLGDSGINHMNSGNLTVRFINFDDIGQSGDEHGINIENPIVGNRTILIDQNSFFNVGDVAGGAGAGSAVDLEVTTAGAYTGILDIDVTANDINGNGSNFNTTDTAVNLDFSAGSNGTLAAAVSSNDIDGVRSGVNVILAGAAGSGANGRNMVTISNNFGDDFDQNGISVDVTDDIGGIGGANTRLVISGNSLNAITNYTGSGHDPDEAIEVEYRGVTAGGTLSVDVTGNTIGGDSWAPDGRWDGNGITVGTAGAAGLAATVFADITNNSIAFVEDAGILLKADESATVSARVTGNTVTGDPGRTTDDIIKINVEADPYTLRTYFGNNSGTDAGWDLEENSNAGSTWELGVTAPNGSIGSTYTTPAGNATLEGLLTGEGNSGVTGAFQSGATIDIVNEATIPGAN